MALLAPAAHESAADRGQRTRDPWAPPYAEASWTPPLSNEGQELATQIRLFRREVSGTEAGMQILEARVTGEFQAVISVGPSPDSLASARNLVELAETVFPDSRSMTSAERQSFRAINAQHGRRVVPVPRNRSAR